MSENRNPFIQDPERLQTSTRRPWFLANVIVPFCVAVIGTVGLVFLIYVVATLNPLGFSSPKQDPYDVSRPVRRWPAPVLINSTRFKEYTSGPGMETMMVTTTQDTADKDHSGPINSSNLVTNKFASANELTTTESPFIVDLTSLAISDWTATTEVSGTKLAGTTESKAANTSDGPQEAMSDPAKDPLYVIRYPHVPAPALCIPSRMDQEEFLDKQWYCYYCWQEARNGTYETSAESETEYRFKCHSNCFNNYAFHSCAIHLYQVETHLPSKGSVRQCRYCKRAMLKALNRTSTKQ